MHKLKVLAGAVTLALAAGTAQASLVTGQAGTDGELFFIAVDGNNHTLVVDLGISYSTLAANAGSTSWFTTLDLGALVTPGTAPGTFTFGAGVQWNLAAGRAGTAVPFTGDSNGLFSTYNLGVSSVDAGNLQLGATFNQANTKLNNYRNITTSKANNLNSEPGNANAFSTDAGADNNYYVFSDPTGPRAFEAGWGDDFNDLAPFKTSGTIGIDDSLAFYHWYLLGAAGQFQVKSELLSGVWTLTQDGLLSYGLATTPVPLPGALWLLGTGLAGLAAAARRRRDSAD